MSTHLCCSVKGRFCAAADEVSGDGKCVLHIRDIGTWQMWDIGTWLGNTNIALNSGLSTKGEN